MRDLLQRIEERGRAWAIPAVRITVGLLWLANIHWKVPSDFGEANKGGLYKYSESVTRNSPFKPFTWVTEELILPNFAFFGWFTLIAEIVIAAMLLVGFRTRLAALAGAGFSVPIMLSVLYYDRADEWSWSYILMIAIHLLIWATARDDHHSLDAAMRRDDAGQRRFLTVAGAVTLVIGVLGLWVARGVDFAGDTAKLLGSDAGFTDADGKLTRRWELKFLWFNPLWALATIALGIALIAGSRRRIIALGAGGLGALLALVSFFMQTFDYARDDGATQKVATGSNVAFWLGLAVVGVLLGRTGLRGVSEGGSEAEQLA